MGKVHKAVCESCLAAGEYDHHVFCGAGLGIFDLYGKHFDAMAAVWDGNQLLATIALAVGTAFLINMGKAKYAWITVAPMLFVGRLR